MVPPPGPTLAATRNIFWPDSKETNTDPNPMDNVTILDDIPDSELYMIRFLLPTGWEIDWISWSDNEDLSEIGKLYLEENLLWNWAIAEREVKPVMEARDDNVHCLKIIYEQDIIERSYVAAIHRR
ncbi:hypothetical protein C8J56DRAFT_1021121 [Mycena floridula]|nr:hypothetical protein C8J56DRAFT_1021121 [Mycena floridula]